MFEALLKTQSAWSDPGAAAAAGEGGGSVRGDAAPGGGAPGPSGLSKSTSMSDARSSFDSRQNSLSRRGGNGGGADTPSGGGGRRCDAPALLMLLRHVATSVSPPGNGF